MNRPCWRNSAALPSVADRRRPRVTERRDDPAKRRFSRRIQTVRHRRADLRLLHRFLGSVLCRSCTRTARARRLRGDTGGAARQCEPAAGSAVGAAYPIIGASGAISGVLGAYLMLFPRANILTLVLLPYFFTTLRISAMLLLLLWFAIQLLGDFAVHGDAAAAYRAHIDGFLAGMLLVVVFKRRSVALFARWCDTWPPQIAVVVCFLNAA